MKMKFTEIFIDLCENISQLELSKAIGINQSQISRYFKGVIPTTKSVIKICDYFNCSLDYIVGLNDNKAYKALQKGYDAAIFYTRYEIVLKKNKSTHYQLAKNGLVCESSLRLWKNGMLPEFQALYNIALSLNSSIDYLLGRINIM